MLYLYRPINQGKIRINSIYHVREEKRKLKVVHYKYKPSEPRNACVIGYIKKRYDPELG